MTLRFAAATFTVVMLFAAPVGAADLRGLITKVDLAHKELHVEALARRARGQTFLFRLDDQTTVRMSGLPGKLADLAAGQRVLVDYDLRDGQRLVRSVTVRGVRPSRPATVEAPTKKDAKPKNDPNAVTGVLRHVAYTEREIIVITPDPKAKEEKQHPFLVPENAKISRDGKPLKFDDLREGESVVVYSQIRDGKKTASAIDAGATTAKAMSPQPNNSRIERLRRILQLVDALLQMAEDKRE